MASLGVSAANDSDQVIPSSSSESPSHSPEKKKQRRPATCLVDVKIIPPVKYKAGDNVPPGYYMANKIDQGGVIHVEFDNDQPPLRIFTPINGEHPTFTPMSHQVLRNLKPPDDGRSSTKCKGGNPDLVDSQDSLRKTAEGFTSWKVILELFRV